jgi:dihydrofolate synthase/folylpolyglutamate synthase
MKISSLQQAEQALLAFIPLVASYGKDGMTLDRLWPLLDLAGNPHQKLKVVHIAGTSGKTSTAYYCTALLAASGKKVGLTVSPHVDHINERIQVGGQLLPEAAFCSYLEQFLMIIKTAAHKPSYFELMIVMALWVFVQEGVDYAVVETGMGGLLDGSNVVTMANKVCVLTDIGFDHTHVLGNTLAKIAAQKAGIMHQGNVAFSYQQPVAVLAAFSSRAATVGAKLNVLSNDSLGLLPQGFTDLPLFQQRNWRLAFAATRYVVQRDHLTAPTTMQIEATLHTVVPARMQVVQATQTLQVIMDGAHNQQKMKAFVSSFTDKYGDVKVPVLLALKDGKDYGEVLEQLLPITKNIMFTTFSTSQDLPAVSVDPQILADYCKHVKFYDYTIVTDHQQAYQKFIASNSGVAIVTGSFYLLSQIRTSLSDK